MGNILMKLLFLTGPKITFSDDEIACYEGLIHQSSFDLKYEDMPYPKYRFIHYLSSTKGYMLHGSNKHDIDCFIPMRQTLYNGKIVDAVFGSNDSIWPVFFAILDRTKVRKSIRNGCFVKGKQKFYFFSLPKTLDQIEPWIEGTLYFLPPESFEYQGKGFFSFDEWTSPISVKPIYQLSVQPEDFYYVSKVSRHPLKEPVWISWIRYKYRLKKQRP